MPRPKTISGKPIFYPFVCIECGVGGPPREWFIDLALTVDQYFNTDNQGVYVCNECWDSITVSAGKLIQDFRQESEAWDNPNVVRPSYEWMNKYDVREPESGESDRTIDGGSESSSEPSEESDGNDLDTESDDPESESSDSGDANATTDGDPDESARKIFGAFFGSQPFPGQLGGTGDD